MLGDGHCATGVCVGVCWVCCMMAAVQQACVCLRVVRETYKPLSPTRTRYSHLACGTGELSTHGRIVSGSTGTIGRHPLLPAVLPALSTVCGLVWATWLLQLPPPRTPIQAARELGSGGSALLHSPPLSTLSLDPWSPAHPSLGAGIGPSPLLLNHWRVHCGRAGFGSVLCV